MREWLESLEQRERLFLGWGVAVTIGILFYLLVMQPLADGLQQVRVQAQGQQEQWEKLQKLVTEYNQLGLAATRSGTGNSEESLLSVVDRTAGEIGLKDTIKRLTPEGTDSVRVSIENADFDKLVGWLAKLAAEHRLHSEAVMLHPNDAVGYVNGNLLLRRI